MGKKCDGLSISETVDLRGFSCTTVSRVCREWCEKQISPSEQQFCGQKRLANERRRARLLRADRKETVTQITTHYNSGVQKSISEHTTDQTCNFIIMYFHSKVTQVECVMLKRHDLQMMIYKLCKCRKQKTGSTSERLIHNTPSIQSQLDQGDGFTSQT